MVTIPPSAIKLGMELFGSYAQQIGDVKQAKAYQKYLNNLTSGLEDKLSSRAAEYEGKLSSMFDEAEPQFLTEANTQLPELQQMQKDISQQSSEAQRQNRAQVQNELAEQGVRGGQAATLSNRATGELNRNLQRDYNQLAYDEAGKRQSSRLNYFGEKAMSPYKGLVSAYTHGSASANDALSRGQGSALADAYGAAIGNYNKTNGNYASPFASALTGDKSMGMMDKWMSGAKKPKWISPL